MLNNRVISKQKCIDYIEKWPFIFNIIYSFLESIFEPCYIQNRVISNRVIKRFKCNNYCHSVLCQFSRAVQRLVTVALIRIELHLILIGFIIYDLHG